MTENFLPLSHANKEVVLTAHFNSTGKRLVTGSADHRLRVFDEKDDDWILIEEWRAHNAEVTEARWHPHPHPPVIASIGEDTRLKIWCEDPTAAPLGGRRFNCVYSQSPPQPSPYTTLAFHATSPTRVFLAIATRNGRLSLLEPEKGLSGESTLSQWNEIDSIWICGQAISRGTETNFRLAFQDAERPVWSAVRAGIDPRAISLAVTALNDVNLYRITPHTWAGGEQYRLSTPVATLSGATNIIRDVAWSPILYRDRDLIATASENLIRIYEIAVPKSKPGENSTSTTMTHKVTNAPSGIGAGLATTDLRIDDVQQGGIRHEWIEVAQLRHDGCWRLEWMQDGNMLVSTGTNETGDGDAHIWASNGKEQEWAEFASIDPS